MNDRRGALFIDPQVHRQVKIAAAIQGVSIKAMAERWLRLGMAAERRAEGYTPQANTDEESDHEG
jgi:hypothetical protein